MALTPQEAAELRQQYLDKREKLLINKVDALAVKLFDKVFNEYLSQLEQEDGNIKNTKKNANYVAGLDKVYKQFNLKENVPVVRDFIKDLQGIAPLNEKYFNTVTDKPTEEATELATKEVNRQLGINDKGALVPNGFADKFIRDDQLIKSIKKETMRAISQKQGFLQFKQGLKRHIEGETGKPLSGGLQQYYRAYAYDTFQKVDRVNAEVFADKLGLIYFSWAGGKIGTSRNMCIYSNAKIFNSLQVKKMTFENLKPAYKEGITKEWVPLRDLGMHNCRHRKDFIPDEIAAKKRDKWGDVNVMLINPIADRNPRLLTKDQWKQHKNFPRDESLKGADAKLQEESIKGYLTNKNILSKEYIERFGNVINTDEARKLFTDIGYNGTNAGAVHEVSSAVGKDATKELLSTSKSNIVEMYAGGAGSGKTSSIERIREGVKDNAAVIIDGTMANYEGSLKKMDQFLSSGKDVNISYSYRDPEDAWKNGVVKRMLSNESEMGRAVSISAFLETTEGSYNTIKNMYAEGIDKKQGVNIYIIDNSLGPGKAQFMSRKKFDSIKFDDELRKKLLRTTKQLLDDGVITKAQYDVLIR